MTLLEEVLIDCEDSSLDEQVKRLCDSIYQEEVSTIQDYVNLPKGPNIFLSLQVPGKTKNETSYLNLEREMPGKFIIVLQSALTEDLLKNRKGLRTKKTFAIHEETAKKIITKYAKMLKFMKGE